MMFGNAITWKTETKMYLGVVLDRGLTLKTLFSPRKQPEKYKTESSFQ
jgi:hypothetical protein